jgi:hypothetical protein
LRKIILVLSLLAIGSTATYAKSCSEAYAACSRGCMKHGLHPSECIGLYCANAKNECMQTGVFTTPKGGTTCRDCSRR